MVTIVDDFEDGDLAGWSATSGSSVSVTTTNPYNGTYSVEVSNAKSSNTYFSTSGLGTYPGQGDEIHFFTNVDSEYTNQGTKFGVAEGHWAVQSEASSKDQGSYSVYIDISNSSVELRKYNSGTTTTLDSASPGLTFQDYYEVTVTWGTDGSMSAEVINTTNGASVATLSATDTTFTSGGVGFTLDAKTSFFDYYHLASTAVSESAQLTASGILSNTDASSSSEAGSVLASSPLVLQNVSGTATESTSQTGTAALSSTDTATASETPSILGTGTTTVQSDSASGIENPTQTIATIFSWTAQSSTNESASLSTTSLQSFSDSATAQSGELLALSTASLSLIDNRATGESASMLATATASSTELSTATETSSLVGTAITSLSHSIRVSEVIQQTSSAPFSWTETTNTTENASLTGTPSPTIVELGTVTEMSSVTTSSPVAIFDRIGNDISGSMIASATSRSTERTTSTETPSVTFSSSFTSGETTAATSSTLTTSVTSLFTLQDSGTVQTGQLLTQPGSDTVFTETAQSSETPSLTASGLFSLLEGMGASEVFETPSFVATSPITASERGTGIESGSLTSSTTLDITELFAVIVSPNTVTSSTTFSWAGIGTSSDAASIPISATTSAISTATAIDTATVATTSIADLVDSTSTSSHISLMATSLPVTTESTRASETSVLHTTPTLETSDISTASEIADITAVTRFEFDAYKQLLSVNDSMSMHIASSNNMYDVISIPLRKINIGIPTSETVLNMSRQARNISITVRLYPESRDKTLEGASVRLRASSVNGEYTYTDDVTIVDAKNGIVEYDRRYGSRMNPGIYNVEFAIDYDGSTADNFDSDEFIPSDEYMTLDVEDRGLTNS